MVRSHKARRMENTKGGRLIKNSALNLFNTFFMLATSWVISIWVARQLGPSNYGIFNLVLWFTDSVTWVIGMGLSMRHEIHRRIQRTRQKRFYRRHRRIRIENRSRFRRRRDGGAPAAQGPHRALFFHSPAIDFFPLGLYRDPTGITRRFYRRPSTVCKNSNISPTPTSAFPRCPLSVK